MIPPSHEKSLIHPNPCPKFELTPLDNRSHLSDHQQTFRDTLLDSSHFLSSQPASAHRSPTHFSQPSLPPTSTFPMKSSVIHQQHPQTAPPSAPLATMQPYSASAPSSAFQTVSDPHHPNPNSFSSQSVPSHPHLPNAINLQPMPPHHNQQQHHHHHHNPQQQPLSSHGHPSPQRSDPQQKHPPSQPQSLRRFSPQQRPSQHSINAKPNEHLQNVPQAHMLPHMPKMQSNMHVMSQQPQQMHHRFQHMANQSHLPPARSVKSESIPSMPLPVHPDPIQSFQPSQDAPDGDRAFSFARPGFFDELPQDDNANQVGLPPPHHNQEPDQGNTLAGVDSITGPLGMPGVAAISNISLPGISGSQNNMHGVHGFGPSTNMGNAAIVGGASEIAEALAADRKVSQCQRRMRAMPRSRSQQMTESQRKQRHNEHTRASRSRIDRGLERLKNTIRKVQPDQKVTKKADVLQVAVKLLKEGYRLPATESDEEREEPPDSALSV